MVLVLLVDMVKGETGVSRGVVGCAVRDEVCEGRV